MCGKKKEIERYIIIPNNNMQPTEKLISDKVIEKDKINHDQIFRKRKMLQKSKRQRKESNNRKRNSVIEKKNFQIVLHNYRLQIIDYRLTITNYQIAATFRLISQFFLIIKSTYLNSRIQLYLQIICYYSCYHQLYINYRNIGIYEKSQHNQRSKMWKY